MQSWGTEAGEASGVPSLAVDGAVFDLILLEWDHNFPSTQLMSRRAGIQSHEEEPGSVPAGHSGFLLGGRHPEALGPLSHSAVVCMAGSAGIQVLGPLGC